MPTAEQLVSEGRIEQAKGSKRGPDDYLSLAKADLKAARDNLPLNNPEWVFRMCQSCALRASLSLMVTYGYLPSREDDLEAVHEFFQSAEPKIAERLSPFLSQQKSPKATVELAEKFLSSCLQQ